jgi:hypothetical protein
MVSINDDTSTAEARAEHRAKYLTGFLWHLGVFVIINGFFVLLDASGPGGLDWSYLIILFWGLGLAFHGLAYLIDGRDVERRKAAQYLEEERGTG